MTSRGIAQRALTKGPYARRLVTKDLPSRADKTSETAAARAQTANGRKIPQLAYQKVINPWVLIQRQTLGSHRATAGTLPTFNKDCETHSSRKIKRYRPD